ncbi:MAG: ribonuclease HII [Candidatus Micrarchaeota archaeon]
MIIAGADEAGRGCVLGPLVICLACIEEDNEAELRKIGAKDSKLLMPKQRERLAKSIRKLCNLQTVHITARELNAEMKRHSLNEIEAMRIGRALANAGEVAAVYVDSPDTETGRFERRIKKYYSGGARIISEHRADYKYAIVSAASIIAKVERDAEIERIKKELDHDFNSGYTSDEATIEFLRNNLYRKDVQQYLRVEWETVARLAQKKITDFEF